VSIDSVEFVVKKLDGDQIAVIGLKLG
ncbi:MAG TPA: hypothetical protein DCQ70_08465, partial [Halieaceae bacterium]|nr:hypothetical protein [Halieaceae bacterium]